MVGEAGEVGRYVPKYVNNRQVDMDMGIWEIWEIWDMGILTKTKGLEYSKEEHE